MGDRWHRDRAMKRLLRDLGKGGLAGLAPFLLIFWMIGGIEASWPIIPLFLLSLVALVTSHVVPDETDYLGCD